MKYLFRSLLAMAFVCLAETYLAGVANAQGAAEATTYYERQTTTEISGQGVHTVSTTTVKVWRKGAYLRIEAPAMPGAQQQVTIRRDGYIYFVNMATRSATKVRHETRPISLTTQGADLQDYLNSLIAGGATQTGTSRIGTQDVVEYTVPQGASGSSIPNVHKIWLDKTSHMPVKETIEAPNVTTTTWYQNLETGEPLSDDLFSIPADFKVVDVTAANSAKP